MNPWEKFKAAIVGRRVQLIRREYDWVLDFGDDLAIVVETLWRLRDENRILVTSDDEGHQFGLPAPLDAEAAANDRLNGVAVVSLNDAAVTPDFTIHLDGGLAVDVIARSAGYESWQTSFGGAPIIGRCK